jgi:hypothetical protein
MPDIRFTDPNETLPRPFGRGFFVSGGSAFGCNASIQYFEQTRTNGSVMSVQRCKKYTPNFAGRKKPRDKFYLLRSALPFD